MRVNILVQGRGDADPTRILPRMAQTLADGTGWTITTAERAGPADLNYYMSYRYRPLLQPFAAYFFHLWNDGQVQGEGRPQDMRAWNEAATKASLRVVTASQYGKMLEPFGPTVKITPPLDREKFIPVTRSPRTGLIRAGVAGYVPADGRKGERHLLQAISTPLGAKFYWRAIGHGWPKQLKEAHLPLERVQEFYQNLDVYVCTSVCEGVPYPPLEALACGIPVIIPRQVGLLDELPDIPGIVRYTAGDSADLGRALTVFEHGWTPDIDRDALRETTAKFTTEAWVEGHMRAFSSLASGPRYSPLVSVIVVTANPASDWFQQCLAHLSRSTIPYELIIIQNQRDWTYAKRVNQGLRAATGDYVLLLNDDCFVEPDALERMVMTCSDSNVGVVGGLLQLPDGRVQHAGGYIDWANQTAGNKHRGERVADYQREDCDFVTGALLMIKRATIDTVGCLNERFSATYEDADWCVRVKKAGYRVVFDPQVRAVHLESVTMKLDLPAQRVRSAESQAYFFQRHKPPLGGPRMGWRDRRSRALTRQKPTWYRSNEASKTQRR